MTLDREVVITGVGVVSPLGVGREAFWAALVEGRSGIRTLDVLRDAGLPMHFGGEVIDFDPRVHVRPRKSLKVMSREIQLGVVAARLARADAGMGDETTVGAFDPERMGVLFGGDMIQADPADIESAYRKCVADHQFNVGGWAGAAMSDVYPLWLLKLLPNMSACHIAIAHDARGPNNTITLGDVSSLLAINEAAHVIARGQADAMIAGGTGARLQPILWVRSTLGEYSQRNDNPAAACRPFDADRDGYVIGEGAAAFVLESRDHAAARGAKILARYLGGASRFEPLRNGASTGAATVGALRAALAAADLKPEDIGHVNADGASTVQDDMVEAKAIREVLGDTPVLAPKSYFGHLGAGAGALELAVSVLALERGVVPKTLNYETPDPACPVNVLTSPATALPGAAIALNRASTGQTAAVVIDCRL